MKINAILVFLGIISVVHFLSSKTDLFFDFSSLYFLVLFSTLAVFVIGYFSGRLFATKNFIFRLAYFFDRRYIGILKARRYFIAFFIFFTALTVLDRVLLLGPDFFLPESVMLYRVLVTQEGVGSAVRGLVLGNFFIFMLPTFLFAFRQHLNVTGMVGMSILFLINVYLSSARSSIFLPVLIVFFYWAIPMKVNTSFLTKAGSILVMLILFFVLIGGIVGKNSEGLGFIVYLVAPLHAFDVLLNDPSELQGHWLSFRPLVGVFRELLDFNATEILPNIMTPLPVNVYSIFGVYYLDYGILGLTIWFLFFGILSGFIEKTYRITESKTVRVYVALNMTILSLGVFYDYYTSSGFVWIIILLAPLFFGQASRKFLPIDRSKVDILSNRHDICAA